MQKTNILLLIVFAGLLLRIIGITDYPPSLNWDEISHGYNAYSILKTGSDEWGKVFPLANFRAYGDYPLPLNLYITIPFIALLGLNDFAIRLPHAIMGTLTIIAVYYLILGITKKNFPALLGSFLVAVEPWYLFSSRFVLQSNLSVLFLIAGMAAFVHRSKSKWLIPLSILFFGLTLYSYHTTRIFTPLLLLALAAIYKKELVLYLKKRSIAVYTAIILFLVFFLPLPFILVNPEARARSQVVFLIDQGAINTIEQTRNNSILPQSFSRLIYNKPTYLLQQAGIRYIEYFSPQFLFLNGGTQYQFSIPKHGLLYAVSLPFFYIGLIAILRKAKRDKLSRLVLVWLLLSPIPAAITQERFAVMRSTAMLPLPQLVIAIGFFTTVMYLAKKQTKILTFLYIMIIFLSLERYLTIYLGEYTKNFSWAWQYGYKQAVTYAKDQYTHYDNIIFTKKYGEPHAYVLFYNQWNPANYKNDPNLIRFSQSNWWWVDRFDKYYFVNDWDIKQDLPEGNRIQTTFVTESKNELNCIDKKCLLVTSPNNYPAGWKKLKTINFLDGKPAFELYEN